MTVVFLSKDDFLGKLKSCILKCRSNGDVFLNIIAGPKSSELFNEMLRKDHRVDSITINKHTIFTIDELRIQVTKVDGYV